MSPSYTGGILAMGSWTSTTITSYAAAAAIGCCSDGTYIWVACYTNPATVVVLRASDGSHVTTVTITGGAYASTCIYDGTYIWVPCYASGTLGQINASTFAFIGNWAVGGGTCDDGVYDGAGHLYIARSNILSVSKINCATHSLIHTTSLSPAEAYDVVFDGTNVWCTSINKTYVTKLDSSLNILATVDVGFTEQGLAFDGTHVWATGIGVDKVWLINVSTNVVDATYSISSNSHGVICFDGTDMWLSSANGGNHVQRMALDGTSLGVWTVVSLAVQSCWDAGTQSFWTPLYVASPSGSISKLSTVTL